MVLRYAKNKEVVIKVKNGKKGKKNIKGIMIGKNKGKVTIKNPSIISINRDNRVYEEEMKLGKNREKISIEEDSIIEFGFWEGWSPDYW